MKARSSRLDSDDVYFSRDDGLAETEHVFLNGCELPGLWRDRNRFVIVETGFGTGLNFLATSTLGVHTVRREECSTLCPLRAFRLHADLWRWL